MLLFLLLSLDENDKSNKDSFDGYEIVYNDFIHQLNVKLKYNRNPLVGYCMAQVYSCCYCYYSCSCIVLLVVLIIVNLLLLFKTITVINNYVKRYNIVFCF